MDNKRIGCIIIFLFLAPLVNFAQTIINLSVKQPQELVSISHYDTLICNGEKIELGNKINFNGGTGQYNYSWLPIEGLSDPSIANPNVIVNDTTFFSITVSDSNGCSATSNVIINTTTPIITNLITDTTVCFGEKILLALKNGTSGGFGSLTYNWLPKKGLSDNTIENPEATITENVVFRLTVKDEYGCFKEDSIKLKASENISINLFSDTMVCFNEVIELVQENMVSGGSGPVSYNWVPTNGLSNSTIKNPEATVKHDITYKLFVSDSLGCSKNDSIKIYARAPLNVNLGNDIEANQPVTLDAGDGYDTYLWNNSTNNSTLEVTESGTYWVIVSDEFGCFGMDTILVAINVVGINEIIKNVMVFPNPSCGDLNIQLTENLNTEIKLYSSNGQLIFIENQLPNPNNRLKIALKNLKKGIYFIAIKNDKTYRTEKIIIQ